MRCSHEARDRRRLRRERERQRTEQPIATDAAAQLDALLAELAQKENTDDD